jgi:hypothetical protein
LPGADCPVASFSEASVNAELVSLDTGGGGPEGEPVGLPAGHTLASGHSVVFGERILGLWEAALSAIMNLRLGNLLQAGGRKVNCLMSILQTAKGRAERKCSSGEGE